MEEKYEDIRTELKHISDFAQENRDRIDRLQEDTKESQVRISLLELMYATEIKRNPFSVTFGNLDGLVAQGVWNVPQKRIDF